MILREEKGGRRERNDTHTQKKPRFLCLMCETWQIPHAAVTEPACGHRGKQIPLFLETVVLCQTAPLLSWHLPLALGTKARDVKPWLSFLKGKHLFFLFCLPLPLSFSYTCRHLRRYVYVLDKLYFPHSHCSTLQHCFSTLSDNGEELLSLTCSHILRSYASRLLTSALHLLHAACPVTDLCMFSVNWWVILISKGMTCVFYGILDVYSKKCVRNGSLVMVWVCTFKFGIQILWSLEALNAFYVKVF